VGGSDVAVLSVEEVIVEPLKALFKASSHALRTSGREDVDVRMLGSGRPFCIELVDPRKLDVSDADLIELQRCINERGGDAVRVSRLQQVAAHVGKSVTTDPSAKRKTYRCLVQTGSPPTDDALHDLSLMRDIQVQQNTPLRVAHRR
jgi:tRNA pseudouridine synthase 10